MQNKYEENLTRAINESDLNYSLLKMNLVFSPHGVNALLKDLFFNSPIVCCLVNSTTGHFDLVNVKFMEELGWDLHESTSKPFIEFIYEPDREITFKTYSIYHADTEGHEDRKYVFLDGYFYNRYVKKGGGHRWMKWGVSSPMITYGQHDEYSIAMAVPVEGVSSKWVTHIKELFDIDLQYSDTDIKTNTI